MNLAKDLVVDLETLGTSPSAAIVSIGAALFDRDGVYDTFYTPVSLESNTKLGRTIDASTVLWWLRQSEEARKQVYETTDLALFGLEKVLKDFTAFFEDLKIQYIWGDGSDFDNVILTDAYRSTGLQRPWTYRSHRCFRTLKNLFPIDEESILKPVGVPHNALYDAMWQAKIASEIFKRYHILEIPYKENRSSLVL